MAGILVFLFGLAILSVINFIRRRSGKARLKDMLAFPIGLFAVMWIIANELGLTFLPTLIIFFFGFMIGGLTEWGLSKSKHTEESQ